MTAVVVDSSSPDAFSPAPISHVMVSGSTAADAIEVAAALLRDTEQVAADLAREGGVEPDCAPDVVFLRAVLHDLRELSIHHRAATTPGDLGRAALAVLAQRRGRLRRVYAVINDWLDDSLRDDRDAGGPRSTMTQEYTAILDGLRCADDLLVARIRRIDRRRGQRPVLGRRGMTLQEAALWVLETSAWPTAISPRTVSAYYRTEQDSQAQRRAWRNGAWFALQRIEADGRVERVPGGYRLRAAPPAPATGMFSIGYLYGEQFSARQ
jgi:hypothetical protein